jgi:hypothetical protein
MTDQSRSGGRVTPQSVVGPIALDKTHAAPVPVHPNSIVGPIALGLTRPVGVLEATCSANAVTIGIDVNGQRAHLIIAVPVTGAPAVTVPPGATLFAISRHEGFLTILLDGTAPNAFLALPVGDGTNVTATVTNAAVT